MSCSDQQKYELSKDFSGLLFVHKLLAQGSKSLAIANLTFLSIGKIKQFKHFNAYMALIYGILEVYENRKNSPGNL